MAAQRAVYYFRVAPKIVHVVRAHPDPLGIAKRERFREPPLTSAGAVVKSRVRVAPDPSASCTEYPLAICPEQGGGCKCETRSRLGLCSSSPTWHSLAQVCLVPLLRMDGRTMFPCSCGGHTCIRGTTLRKCFAVFSGDSKSAEGNLVGVRPPSRHHIEYQYPLWIQCLAALVGALEVGVFRVRHCIKVRNQVQGASTVLSIPWLRCGGPAFCWFF
jgi:hypothetical protein